MKENIEDHGKTANNLRSAALAGISISISETNCYPTGHILLMICAALVSSYV
jgi:hypothetical protein